MHDVGLGKRWVGIVLDEIMQVLLDRIAVVDHGVHQAIAVTLDGQLLNGGRRWNGSGRIHGHILTEIIDPFLYAPQRFRKVLSEFWNLPQKRHFFVDG